jgi:hypothetical protein
VVQWHGRAHGVDEEECDDFFQEIHDQAYGGAAADGNEGVYEDKFSFELLQQMHGDVPAAAQRLWTSDANLQGAELCSMMNAVLRADCGGGNVGGQIPALCRLTRAMEQLSVGRLLAEARAEAAGEAGEAGGAGGGAGGGAAGAGGAAGDDGTLFPPGGSTYRGGGLPDEHRDFFTVGKQFRVPMFLATSMDQNVTQVGLGGDGWRVSDFVWVWWRPGLGRSEGCSWVVGCSWVACAAKR